LQQTVVDLEKVIDDFAIEQTRLKTKQMSLLQQTTELEAELTEKGLLSSEQNKRFSEIQQKL